MTNKIKVLLISANVLALLISCEKKSSQRFKHEDYFSNGALKSRVWYKDGKADGFGLNIGRDVLWVVKGGDALKACIAPYGPTPNLPLKQVPIQSLARNRPLTDASILVNHCMHSFKLEMFIGQQFQK